MILNGLNPKPQQQSARRMHKSQPIASLPMYDWSEVSSRYDALWTALSGYLQDHGIAAPNHLSRASDGAEFWLHPKLMIGQTCGYPFWSRLRGKVSVLGAPHYAIDGCGGHKYRSAILAQADAPWSDLSKCDGASVAINEAGSLSGHFAMRAALGAARKEAVNISSVYKSGAHRHSMQMVADGHADICAIDAVCWDMAQDFMPDVAEKLKIISWSPQMPGLPWITAPGSEEDLQNLRLTLKSFFSESTYKSVYKVLKISGFSNLADSDYAPVGQLAEGRSHTLFPPLLC